MCDWTKNLRCYYFNWTNLGNNVYIKQNRYSYTCRLLLSLGELSQCNAVFYSRGFQITLKVMVLLFWPQLYIIIYMQNAFVFYCCRTLRSHCNATHSRGPKRNNIYPTAKVFKHRQAHTENRLSLSLSIYMWHKKNIVWYVGWHICVMASAADVHTIRVDTQTPVA